MPSTTTKIVIARQDGSILGQYVLGAGEHIIGREIDCAIYINDPHVSRAHARLIITEEAVEIEDLNSTSGTYLDGVTVRGRIPVAPAQMVHISDLYIDIVREGFRELIPGARLTNGRFTLIKLLGQGGMGAVWLARDEVHEQEVALKLLPGEMANDELALEDLEREVAKTATLDHKNILRIEGLIRTEDEPPFILMEYVAGPQTMPGTDLDHIRRKSPNRLMPWSGVRHYMLQLCDALEYAHQQQIAHRDIKPSNLLINQDAQLKLADFGIAASIAGTASTMTINVLDAGTPSYMSPQQIEGRLPQATDDIYSLGATFYDLLTSKPPFYHGNIIHQVLNLNAPPIAERLTELGLQNEVPDFVSSMVMACLQKDPAHRPPSAAAVKKWIETEGKEDFASAPVVQWEDPPAPTVASAAPAATVASAVKTDWLPKAQRKKILSYGAVAAVMAILIGTATWWTGKPKDINGVSPAMQAQLKEGLVAYYPFNGNAKDESGNGNDGEVNGATLTADRHGKSNNAYGFDGNDDSIVINEYDPFNALPITISFWAKSKQPNQDAGIIDRYMDGSYNGWCLRMSNNGKIWPYYIGSVKSQIIGKHHPTYPQTKQFETESLAASKWYHCVLTVDSIKGNIYLNGQFQDDMDWLGPPEKTSNNTKLTIGHTPSGNGQKFPFDGSIDDVRIYNRALSADEVSALYDSEKPTTPSFRIIEGRLTWPEAKADAEAKGGRLAVLDTRGKIEEANTLVRNHKGSATKIANAIHLWIGLTDQATEGKWKWINGKDLDANDWAENEPNANGRTDPGAQHHAVIVGPGGNPSEMGWHDDGGANKYSYLIEFP